MAAVKPTLNLVMLSSSGEFPVRIDLYWQCPRSDDRLAVVLCRRPGLFALNIFAT